MIFDSWEEIVQILFKGLCAYLSLILFLRISGKRTLSKMNSFDFVVTIALGSTLSSILLSKDIALIEGLTALILLILLQFIFTWLSVRFRWVNRLIKNEPALLVRSGKLLRQAMHRERVIEVEILQAIRNQNVGSLTEVEALVLETDGSMSVIKGTPPEPVAWHNVKNFN